MKRSNKKVAGPRVAAAALDMKAARVKAKPAAPVAVLDRAELSPIDPPAGVEEIEASLSEALTQARQGNDFSGLCDRIEMLRRRLPDSELGFRFGAIALREANRLDDATALLAGAPARFAERYWLLAEHVVLAQKRQDWQEAATRAALLRERFPKGLFGWQAGCDALQKIGDLAAAERLLEEAACVLGEADANYPGKEWLLTTATWLAVRREAWQLAGQRAARLRECFPANEQGWLIGLRSLRLTKRYAEFEGLLKQAETEQPGKIFLLTEAAALAQLHGNYAEASQQWQRVREARPDLQDGYVGGIQVSSALGRFDEAEVIVQELLTRLPTFRWALVEAARLAQQRLDYAEADRRWNAAALLLPEDRIIRLNHAMVHSLHPVDAERDWPTTLQRLKLLHDDFPDYAEGWQTHIRVLRSQGMGREAEQLAESCIQKMPDDPELRIQYAHLATDRGDLELGNARMNNIAQRFPDNPSVQRAVGKGPAAIAIEAAKRQEPDWEAANIAWRKAFELAPDDPIAHAGLGKSFRRIGKRAQAEEILAAAQKRFPGNYQIAHEYADMAADVQDWKESLRRWQSMADRFPKAENVQDALARARWQESYNALLEAPPGKDKDAGNITELSSGDAAIMGRFESLGENCEFGLVQRYHGLEPLGLLRFSYVHQRSLLDLLKNRFAGVGDPQFTSLDRTEGEYLVSDKRYGMGSHTYVPPHSVDRDAFFKEQCRKLSFLRRKMLETLDEAGKIFVVTAHAPASDASAMALYTALREYGPNRLLYVRVEAPDEEPGSVRQVEDGLVFGYLDRWGGEPSGRWNISHAVWLSLCQRAEAAFDGPAEEIKPLLLDVQHRPGDEMSGRRV